MYDPGNHDIQIQSVTLEQSGGAPTNRITSVTAGSTVNYTYDAAGNVSNDGVHSYTYDSENRLVSVDGGSTAQYSYDHQNRRYKKTIGSTVTHYTWEGSRVLGEYSGATGALLVNYWYAGGRLFKKTGITTQVFLSDPLSVRLALSDIGVVAGRQAHLPFGEDFGESGTQEKHHFTSYERDAESSADYALNRQYIQTIGRFARPDPYMGSNDLGHPQTLNRYAYVENDPINAVDPLGLLSFCDFVDDGEGTIYLVCWEGGGGGSDYPEVGGGGGGSAGRPSPKKRVKQFFKTEEGKNCAKFLNDPNHPSRPSADWVEHVAAYANWVDLTAPGFKKKTFAELGIEPPDAKSLNDRVSSWLGPGLAPDGRRYSAFTDFGSQSWQVYIGGNYASATPGQQAIIAVHESLHMALTMMMPAWRRFWV